MLYRLKSIMNRLNRTEWSLIFRGYSHAKYLTSSVVRVLAGKQYTLLQYAETLKFATKTGVVIETTPLRLAVCSSNEGSLGSIIWAGTLKAKSR